MYFLFNRCVPCPSNCQNCYYLFGKQSRQLICPSCQEGSFLYEKRCEICREGCAKCVGPRLTDCYQLSSGYGFNISSANNSDSLQFEISTSTAVFSPVQCPLASGCRSCNPPVCHYCLPKFGKDSKTKECLPCKVENCDFCVKSANGEDVCVACSKTYFLDLFSNLCIKCDSNCEECDPDGFCITCKEGQKLSESQKCECNQGYYADETGTCKKCPENCGACSMGYSCDECNPGYWLSGGECKKCSVEYCMKCDDQGCITCMDGFYSKLGKCKACDVNYNCLTCKEEAKNKTKCLTCPDVLRLNSTNFCEFPPNYTTYLDFNNKICIPGYYYDKDFESGLGGCLPCRSSTHKNANRCILCAVSVSDPSNYVCESCELGFVLENGMCMKECTADLGFFYDPIIRDCVKQEVFDFTSTGIRPLMVYNEYSPELKMNGIYQQSRLVLISHEKNHTVEEDCEDNQQCFCHGKVRSPQDNSCICNLYFFGRSCQLYLDESNGIKKFLNVSMAENPNEAEKSYSISSYLESSSYYILLHTLFAINNLTHFLGDKPFSVEMNDKTIKLFQKRLEKFETISNTIEDIDLISNFLTDIFKDVEPSKGEEVPPGLDTAKLSTSYIFISNVISTIYPGNKTFFSAKLPGFVHVNKQRFCVKNEDSRLFLPILIGPEDEHVKIDLQFNFKKMVPKSEEVVLDIVSGLFEKDLVEAITSLMGLEEDSKIVNSPFTFKFMEFADKKIKNYKLDNSSKIVMEVPLSVYSYQNEYICSLFSAKKEVIITNQCNFLGFNGSSIKGICSCEKKDIEEYVVLVTMNQNQQQKDTVTNNPKNVFIDASEKILKALNGLALLFIFIWFNDF